MTAQNRSWPTLAPLYMRTFADKLVKGLYAVTHNSMAFLGLIIAVAAMLLVLNPDIRDSAEQKLLSWLLQRQPAEMEAASEPADRVTAANPTALPKDQAQVADWLSRKYRVAPEPVSALVAEAFDLGRQIKLDPTLILAVMAVESSFYPFAQSPVGAQGLMQVMTRVHTDKYEDFGGKLAAFDPVSNLRVGVKVLQDCIRTAGGSIEGGLRAYVGAVDTDSSDYVSKVMAERDRLQSVARGVRVPVTAPNPAPVAHAAAPSKAELDAVVRPPLVDADHRS